MTIYKQNLLNNLRYEATRNESARRIWIYDERLSDEVNKVGGFIE